MISVMWKTWMKWRNLVIKIEYNVECHRIWKNKSKVGHSGEGTLCEYKTTKDCSLNVKSLCLCVNEQSSFVYYTY